MAVSLDPIYLLLKEDKMSYCLFHTRVLKKPKKGSMFFSTKEKRIFKRSMLLIKRSSTKDQLKIAEKFINLFIRNISNTSTIETLKDTLSKKYKILDLC